MKNTQTEIKVKNATLQDIAEFVNNNVNDFEIIKQAILKANNKAIVTDKKIILDNSEIWIYNSYNPYPNKMWKVM